MENVSEIGIEYFVAVVSRGNLSPFNVLRTLE